jgi:hypothetical protein
MMRIVIPHHLRTLAQVEKEVALELPAPLTLGAALTALEERYPVLRGTIRDQVTLQRRPFIRFFVGGQDWSHHPTETELPEAILNGSEPLRIVGAMAGG